MTADADTPTPETSGTNNEKAWPTLTIDYALYDKYLEGANLSDEEKREFLDTLWNVIVAFVDMGFGVHPVQQICEQALDLSDQRFGGMLESKVDSRSKESKESKEFSTAANNTQPDNTERKEA